jgi:hypothetical protein
VGTIDSIANLLSEAQVRNFRRWPILGNYVWPNAYIGPTYKSEVDYLKNWLLARLLWLDENFYTVSIDPNNPPPGFSMYPNPAKDHVLIENDYVPWREQRFNITLFDYMGRATLEQEYSGLGVQRIELPRDQLPQGVYYYKVNDQQGREWRGRLVLVN